MAGNENIKRNYANIRKENICKVWKDARFHHLVTDPRFKSFPRAHRTVKIDNRFRSMFTDDIFKVKYTVDKYGRKLNKSSSDNLKKFYDIQSSSDSDIVEGEKQEEDQTSRYPTTFKENRSEPCNHKKKYKNGEVKCQEEATKKTLKEHLLNPDTDYARGEGRLVTDSSSDESTDDDETPMLNMDHVWGELDADAELTDKSTRRLAICHMDWDRIRAVDLMVVFSSFLPPGGAVLSIKIYRSEYGKERMAEEEVCGPIELVNYAKERWYCKNADKSECSNSNKELLQLQDSDCEEGDAYHMEKLRQYQLNRLRYYYAVAEFNNVQTADKVYQECDGLEYESSATRMDLRFIPDNTTFDDEPADVCTCLPDITYMPRHFTTTALQQAKVTLTWDETSLERHEISEKLSNSNLKDVEDKDLKKVIAISSSDNDDDDSIIEENLKLNINGTNEKLGFQSGICKIRETKEDIINKYRVLLAEIDDNQKKEKTKKYEMEFSWNIESNVNNDDNNHNDENNIAHDITNVEKVILKRSEKNKRRKEERKKRKRLAQGNVIKNIKSDTDSDSIPDGIDMNDSYFTEEFTDGDFVDAKSKKKNESHNIEKELEEQLQFQEEQKAKELQLLINDDENEQNKQHFSLKKILKSEKDTNSKKKRRKLLKISKLAIAKKRKELVNTFKVNVNDYRFKAMYSDHLYNIDPTDSHFKKTKGMEQIIEEKLRRRYSNENVKHELSAIAEVETNLAKKQLENNILIKNLKHKIQQ